MKNVELLKVISELKTYFTYAQIHLPRFPPTDYKHFLFKTFYNISDIKKLTHPKELILKFVFGN